ncbi:MAG: protein kinase, partial [Myxococcota bacterium]
MEQFWSEAQLPAQLKHPSIISVFDVGQTPEGVPFYTMEVMERKNLGDRFRELHEASQEWAWFDDGSPGSLGGLVEALAKAAEGVAFAHDNGVVHRDLKPKNIIVGSHGEVRVADWGIAKVLDGGGDLQTVRTEQGGAGRTTVIGSPSYRAPEVRKGFAGDARRDVYALGAT